MLALRSSGIDIIEYKNLFGNAWLKKNYSYFEKLKNQNFIMHNNDFIKLTTKGYAVCDEILKNLL
jgi:oxygen-independent coproporphyrinogen-3 oxidase